MPDNMPPASMFRTKEGLGVWEHKGKVAAVGVGHSPTARRWDGTPEKAVGAQAIIAQYSEYEPLPGAHINGQLTQGENIADLGGVKLAYAALQKALEKNPSAREQKIDGFTLEQRFFLSFATIWKSKQRDADLKLRLNTDPHSPAHYRVNGPLSDLPEFAKAFNIPDGSPMVRAADKRVNIW